VTWPLALRRPLRALIAALFLLVWGKSAVIVHACPVHEGRAAASAMAAEHGGDAATAGGHESDGHGGGDHGGPCRCVGQACPTLVAVVPPTAAVTWREVLVDRAVEPTYAAHAAPSAPAPRLLPFANGPPSLA
jgi:hypothetical protein